MARTRAHHARTRPLRRLLLALWVGGLATIDLVETPARFATAELDRNQIVAIGRRVFASINRIEVVLGLALLPLVWREGRRGLRATALTMWGVALAQYAIVQPRMHRVAAGLDFVRRAPADPRYRRHRRLHGAYVALDALKLALGVWAIVSDDE